MGDEGVLSRLARVCSAALGQDAGADLSFVNPVVYLNWHFYIELCFFGAPRPCLTRNTECAITQTPLCDDNLWCPRTRAR